jgi:hypothetical protein
MRVASQDAALPAHDGLVRGSPPGSLSSTSDIRILHLSFFFGREIPRRIAPSGENWKWTPVERGLPSWAGSTKKAQLFAAADGVIWLEEVFIISGCGYFSLQAWLTLFSVLPRP